jgi:phage RecT family recombinase
MESEVAKQLPKHLPVAYFMRTVMTGMRKSDQLAKCDRASLFAAILEAARFGLMPFTEEAAIVAFGQGPGKPSVATFIPQYQGLVQMFYRTGQVSAVEAHMIHKFDDWGLGYGDSGGFYHKPLMDFDDEGNAKDPGPPILAYCYVQLRDGSRSTVATVTRQQAIKVRDERSRSYQNAEKSWNGRPPKRNSTWHTEFDAMWLKTAVRQVAKWVPKSPELVSLLMAAARDDEQRPDGAEPEPLSGWGLDIDGGNMAVGEVLSESFEDAAPAGQAAPVPDRARDMRHMMGLFREFSLDGDRWHGARLAVMGMFLRPGMTGALVELKSQAELSDEQVTQMVQVLETVKVGRDRKPRPAEEVKADLLKVAHEGGWQDPAADPPGGS